MANAARPPGTDIQENVHVTGRRILATIVDGLVFGVLYIVMAGLFGTITTRGFLYWQGDLPTLPSVAYGVLVVLYYILLEGYLGQTLGKMLLGIKVVREDNGEVPGLGAATIRTSLCLIDGCIFPAKQPLFQVEPRGFEPLTSAVQRRRSPS